jgi:hypothetical protein
LYMDLPGAGSRVVVKRKLGDQVRTEGTLLQGSLPGQGVQRRGGWEGLEAGFPLPVLIIVPPPY